MRIVMELIAKERMKNALPPELFYMLRGLAQKKDLVANYIYDFIRYLKWSPIGGKPKTPVQLLATITMDYHRIEKGFSLPQTRPGFGVDVVKRLAFNIPRYAALENMSDLPLRATYGALKQWLELSEGANSPAEQDAKKTVQFIEEKIGKCSGHGGAVTLKKSDIVKQTHPGFFKDFFESRFSVRDFTDDKVSVEELKQAISVARKTPSVCNRQSWRVHAFLEPETCREVLALQNGNRGFGEKVNAVLVITSELQTFLSAGERYQGWIDGGMFAMSLTLALHAQGIGSCCLNWSVSSKADRRLRKHMNLPDNELVIMMIAIGHLKDEFKVATSPRIDVDDILVSVR